MKPPRLQARTLPVIYPAQNEIITHLRDEVVQGVALSNALMSYPETFPPLFQNMIKAGEAIAQGALGETVVEHQRDGDDAGNGSNADVQRRGQQVAAEATTESGVA